MIISESSINIDCPDNAFFRFEDCQGYKNIQNNLREMDICRYDAEEDILYIIELKDWGDSSLNEENDGSKSQDEIEEIKKKISQHRIRTLVEKSISSVCMIMSGLLGMTHGNKIKECYGFSITAETKIKLISIINWDEEDVTYISNVNSAYRDKFSPYAKLFNIKSYLVLTKRLAKEYFSWVS